MFRRLCWAPLAFGLALSGLIACSNDEAASPAPVDAGPDVVEPTPDAAPPTTVGDILGGLGVVEYKTPPPATVRQIDGGTTTIDTDTWQPLKKSPAVFSPRAEVFMIGTTTPFSGGVIKAAYFTDGVGAAPYAVSNPFPLAADQTLFQGNSARLAIAADVDGDGIQEIVLVYTKDATDTNLYFRVYEAGAFGTEGQVPGLAVSDKRLQAWTAAGRAGIGSPWFPYFTATRGDLDGDGKDSVLLVDYDTLYVLAFAKNANGYWTAAFDGVKDKHKFQGGLSGVAAGDIDGDGAEELAVGLGNQWAVYRGGFATPLTSPEFVTVAQGNGPVEVTFGDFAGSGLKQLAIATTKIDALGHVDLYDFSPGAPGLRAPVGTIKVTDNWIGDMNNVVTDLYRLLPRAVDLRGNGKAALEVLGQIFYSPLTASDSTQPDFTMQAYTHDMEEESSLLDVQIGDVDNDAKQDIVYLTCGLDGVAKVWSYGLNGASTPLMVRKNAYPVSASYPLITAVGGAIAVGNFEDNTARVKYDKHTLTFSDPIVIAVLASPPYWSDLAASNPTYADSVGNWTTTFGQTTKAAGSSSTSVGFSVGFSVEFEHDVTAPIFNLPIAKFKASASFTNTNKWEWTDSREVTKSVIFSATAGQDNVIFTAVPIDDYAYTIVATNDPVNNPVGRSIHITIPRSYTTYMVERGFFNAHTNAAMTAPIDERILPHTLGKASTYPTVDKKNETMAACFALPTDIADYQYGGADPLGTMVAESDAQERRHRALHRRDHRPREDGEPRLRHQHLRGRGCG